MFHITRAPVTFPTEKREEHDTLIKTRYLKVDDWIGTVRLYVDKYKKTITDHINIKCPTFVDR
jgi:hypothetical protein